MFLWSMYYVNGMPSTERAFLLPPASEGWGKVMFSVCPHLGGVTQPTHPGWGGSQPGGGRVSPGWVVAKIGQQNEYSIHSGRYASCVHPGGLSCCLCFCEITPRSPQSLQNANGSIGIILSSGLLCTLLVSVYIFDYNFIGISIFSGTHDVQERK